MNGDNMDNLSEGKKGGIKSEHNKTIKSQNIDGKRLHCWTAKQ